MKQLTWDILVTAERIARDEYRLKRGTDYSFILKHGLLRVFCDEVYEDSMREVLDRAQISLYIIATYSNRPPAEVKKYGPFESPFRAIQNIKEVDSEEFFRFTLENWLCNCWDFTDEGTRQDLFSNILGSLEALGFYTEYTDKGWWAWYEETGNE